MLNVVSRCQSFIGNFNNALNDPKNVFRVHFEQNKLFRKFPRGPFKKHVTGLGEEGQAK